MAQHIFTSGVGDTEVDEVVEIPDAVIEAASGAAFDEDRLMVVGHHPYFGWVYRDSEDVGAIAELGNVVSCDSAGLVA